MELQVLHNWLGLMKLMWCQYYSVKDKVKEDQPMVIDENEDLFTWNK